MRVSGAGPNLGAGNQARTPVQGQVVPMNQSAAVRDYLQPVRPMDARLTVETRLEMIRRQVEGVNRYLETAKRYKDIRFGLDERADGIYALITDRQSGRVLKVIPPQSLPFSSPRLEDIAGGLMNVIG